MTYGVFEPEEGLHFGCFPGIDDLNFISCEFCDVVDDFSDDVFVLLAKRYFHEYLWSHILFFKKPRGNDCVVFFVRFSTRTQLSLDESVRVACCFVFVAYSGEFVFKRTFNTFLLDLARLWWCYVCTESVRWMSSGTGVWFPCGGLHSLTFRLEILLWLYTGTLQDFLQLSVWYSDGNHWEPQISRPSLLSCVERTCRLHIVCKTLVALGTQ